MSRIGKYPIEIPDGVACQVADNVLQAKGKLGELKLPLPPEVAVEVVEGKIKVTPKSESKQSRALWGTIRAVAQNMVTGVSKGFERHLQLNGVGYRAAMQGKTLVLSLGFSHEVRFDVPESIDIKCAKPTEIAISGFDKQRVGQVAAKIRSYRPPEPYKGKGVKYAQEVIYRKEGKKK